MSDTRRNTNASLISADNEHLINADEVKLFHEKIKNAMTIKKLEEIYREALSNMTQAYRNAQKASTLAVKDPAAANEKSIKEILTYFRIYENVKKALEDARKIEWQGKMKGLPLSEVKNLRDALMKEQVQWHQEINQLKETIELMNKLRSTDTDNKSRKYDVDNAQSYAEINRMISTQIVKLEAEKKTNLENQARQKAMTQPSPNKYGEMPTQKTAPLQRPRVGRVSPPPVVVKQDTSRPGYNEIGGNAPKETKQPPSYGNIEPNPEAKVRIAESKEGPDYGGLPESAKPVSGYGKIEPNKTYEGYKGLQQAAEEVEKAKAIKTQEMEKSKATLLKKGGIFATKSTTANKEAPAPKSENKETGPKPGNKM
jgi:hypothetical protein